MRKLEVLGIVAALFVFGFAANAQAQDWKIGLGCEGMYFGPVVQGASVRAWTGPIGLEGNLFTGYAKADLDATDPDDDATYKVKMNAIGLKGMYAPVVKTNSKFYVGAEVNYGDVKADLGDYLDGAEYKGKMWTYGPFMGSEFNFQEIPEIGFNLEVGYIFNNVKFDNDDNDDELNLDVNGINVSLGVHYYF